MSKWFYQYFFCRPNSLSNFVLTLSLLNTTKNKTEIMSCVLRSPADGTWTAHLFLWRKVAGICSSLTGRDGAQWRPLPLLDYGRDFQLVIICQATDSPTATQSQLSLCAGAHTHTHTHMPLSDKSVWNCKDTEENLDNEPLLLHSGKRTLPCLLIYTDSRI